MNIETVKKVMSGVVSSAIEQADDDLGELLEAERDEELAAVVTMLRAESSLAMLRGRTGDEQLIDVIVARLENLEHRR